MTVATELLLQTAEDQSQIVAYDVPISIKAGGDGASQAGELLVVNRKRLIDLKSLYGLSDLRDIQTTTGSGSISNTVGGGEYNLTTTADGSDSAILESAERGRYVAGEGAEAGIGIRVSAVPSGNQVARWGYFDDDNGFGFGVDATGIFIFVRKGGSDEVIRQDNWNKDRLNGNGGDKNPTLLDLDLAVGQIFQITFTYYGYGPCYFQVKINDDTSTQRVVTVHKYAREDALVIEDPNLPLRAEIDNDGEVSAFDGLHVGGRTFAIIGDYDPNRRVTSEYRLELGSVGTTFLPTVSLQRKSAYKSVSVKIEGISIITDADLLIQIRVNGSLTGENFGTPTDHTATETAMEADNEATAISGGEVLYEDLVDSSGSGSNASGTGNLRNLDFDLPALQPVTLAVRRVSGTGATVSVVLRVREEW